MNKNSFIAVGLLLVSGIAIPAWKHQGVGEQGVVQIGALFPLTGDASSYGQKGRRAIEMAVGDCNAQLDAANTKVAAVFEDSKGSARDGVSAGQKLIAGLPWTKSRPSSATPSVR